MHHLIGLGTLVTAIWFVFGTRAAQIFVGLCLAVGASFFLYVMMRIIEGTI